MKKEIISDQTLTQWIETSDKLNAFAIQQLKKLTGFAAKMVIILIGYSIMSWIFLNIYDAVGFEKTLIILLVGVLWYGLRQPIPKRQPVPKGK